MPAYGVAATLVGGKALACLFLVSLYRVAHLPVSQWGLLLTAASYFVLSFLPWWVLLFPS